MNIKFANTEIREYAVGNLHFMNDGKAFEVDPLVGQDLLWQKHFLNGEMVNVFEPAANQAPPVSVSDYPETFPQADVLAEAGFTHEEVLMLTREQLIDIKGIGPKTADAILAFHGGEQEA